MQGPNRTTTTTPAIILKGPKFPMLDVDSIIEDPKFLYPNVPSYLDLLKAMNDTHFLQKMQENKQTDLDFYFASLIQSILIEKIIHINAVIALREALEARAQWLIEVLKEEAKKLEENPYGPESQKQMAELAMILSIINSMMDTVEKIIAEQIQALNQTISSLQNQIQTHNTQIESHRQHVQNHVVPNLLPQHMPQPHRANLEVRLRDHIANYMQYIEGLPDGEPGQNFENWLNIQDPQFAIAYHSALQPAPPVAVPEPALPTPAPVPESALLSPAPPRPAPSTAPEPAPEQTQTLRPAILPPAIFAPLDEHWLTYRQTLANHRRDAAALQHHQSNLIALHHAHQNLLNNRHQLANNRYHIDDFATLLNNFLGNPEHANVPSPFRSSR